MFGLYTKEMLVRAKETGLGMNVGDKTLGLLLYADDVVLLSESSEDLQQMLIIIQSTGMNFISNSAVKKSQIMVANGKEIAKERENMDTSEEKNKED